MTKTIVVWSCAHADPSCSNERFDWLGNFLYDLKPDLAVDLGDGADMKSLNTFDTRYPQAIVNQSYEADIESYNDSQDRLRHKFRHMKKGKPFWVGMAGNHEARIDKAISHDPRLEGQKYGVSFSHLQTDHWFNEYHPYSNGGPAIASYCGVDFSHYFSSGNYGSAISGIHHAYTLIQNRHRSSVCGHSHKLSVHHNTLAGSIGLVVGCYKGKEEDWAGQSNDDWWKGVAVLRDVDNGWFDLELVGMNQLRREYG